MKNTPFFEESYWFIRVLETEEFKYDMIKSTFFDVDEKNYVSLKKILEEKEVIIDDDFNQSEHLIIKFIKITSKSKFNGTKQVSDSYRKYFNKELPKNIENCLKKHDEIYLCLNEILKKDEVIRIDISQIFNWIGEYLDLFIMLELINDIMPSKRGRHLNQLDTELRDYFSIRSKYLSKEDDINLGKYKKFRNYNFHWSNNHKVRPEMILNLMSDLFSEKINRIDNFYLPAIIKQIWFTKDINDRQICTIIIPLIKLLKSVDQRSSHRIFHTTKEAFENDPIIRKGQIYSCFEEYCYTMINRLVKTKH